jgi:hypothetical protein
MNKRIFDTSAANETIINSSNAQGDAFYGLAVGAKNSENIKLTTGPTLEWGEAATSPVLYVGLESPGKDEVLALSSAGEKSFGIAYSGPVALLICRYALGGEPILDLDFPYHAGIKGNAGKEFKNVLQETNSFLLNNRDMGLAVTTVVFDVVTGIIYGLNHASLPSQCSRLLVNKALHQVQEPIDKVDYERWVAKVYRACPTWKSLRGRAVCWERSR